MTETYPQGSLDVRRASDGEVLGRITCTQGGITAHRLRAPQLWLARDAVPLEPETRDFALFEAAYAWVSANPYIPDPLAADPDLILLDRRLARIVWRGPNGAVLARCERHAGIGRTPPFSVLFAFRDEAPRVRAEIRPADDSWALDRYDGARPVADPVPYPDATGALEAAAAMSLVEGTSAHERLAFEDGREDRTALFARIVADVAKPVVSDA